MAASSPAPIILHYRQVPPLSANHGRETDQSSNQNETRWRDGGWGVRMRVVDPEVAVFGSFCLVNPARSRYWCLYFNNVRVAVPVHLPNI
ncbi:unnamed protein product [Pleuronectes platessa]|uniref:Uncharacterized protein n=1 Tax=Pleuronectes platessa TaxID=8262 RepID=A0A9N7VR71_PLEPL|nr:unnamed protein product [Pleuronectes platessa]